jgi:hypothetical protein
MSSGAAFAVRGDGGIAVGDLPVLLGETMLLLFEADKNKR